MEHVDARVGEDLHRPEGAHRRAGAGVVGQLHPDVRRRRLAGPRLDVEEALALGREVVGPDDPHGRLHFFEERAERVEGRGERARRSTARPAEAAPSLRAAAGVTVEIPRPAVGLRDDRDAHRLELRTLARGDERRRLDAVRHTPGVVLEVEAGCRELVQLGRARELEHDLADPLRALGLRLVRAPRGNADDEDARYQREQHDAHPVPCHSKPLSQSMRAAGPSGEETSLVPDRELAADSQRHRHRPQGDDKRSRDALQHAPFPGGGAKRPAKRRVLR